MTQPWVVEELARRIGAVVESLTGELPQNETELIDAPDSGPTLWWRQDFATQTGFTIWAGAPENSWQGIGTYVLGAAGVEQPRMEDVRSTYDELIHQSFSTLAYSMATRLRQEVACANGWESAPQAGTVNYCLRLIMGGEEIKLFACFGEEAIAAFENGEAQNHGAAAKLLSPAQEVPAKPETKAAIPKSLDLLIDVELPVSVSFGRAQLPLRDVLKLTTGSIVELNRAVSEPVEVIVNNCVIARGQVVVIEGNFGVRINQVISRQDRLRTLK